MTDLRPRAAAARTPLAEPGPGDRVCWVPPAVLRPQRTRWQRTWPLLVGLAVTVGLVVLSLNVGAFDLGAEGGAEMFWITRVPRTVALVLAGAALALCGLIMQLMTQNRFVEPSTTGTMVVIIPFDLLSTVAARPTLLLRRVPGNCFKSLKTMVL